MGKWLGISRLTENDFLDFFPRGKIKFPINYQTRFPMTAQRLVKIRESLSPAEKRFERRRHTAGLYLGPLAALILLLYPMPQLTSAAHRLAGIIGWIVIWWITEPIPIPMSALLGAVLCVLFGIAPARQVFAPFADPTIYLFLGSFILAEGMAVHGLHKRFAWSLMSLPWVGSSPARILLVYGGVSAAISMWISNTATAAMMLPIGLGIISASGGGEQLNRFSTGLLLMVAYASSTGGIGTPVGTPPNLIGLAMLEKFAGIKISFFQWMLFALPLLVVMYAMLYCILYLMHRPDHPQESLPKTIALQQNQVPFSRGERNALIAFLVTVLLWILPGLATLIGGPASALAKILNDRLPEAAAALIGASLLFILPINWPQRHFTLSWKQAAHIDWGTLVLFGGGIALGQLMFETKLAESIGTGLLNWSGASSTWSVTLAAIYIAILVSETTSNTASANMVVPVMISLCLSAQINPIPPALGATLGASWGFMLPVSTPPNAIVYGSGLVPITKMIRAGILFDLLGGAIIWLGLRILLPLIGLA
ncbi:MAG: DASS family sodium-coupled anion symporter [Desulforhabdus sp.]|jgi:sodium-dependent dicarboxylate transporter 2/3/5|nr:DASS family sodium-coupled anion symporter [Desulforhabdus sp.]